MRVRWKIIGLAGLAGVATTGVVIARTRRAQQHYDPAELRERLHGRLAEVPPGEGSTPVDVPGRSPRRLRARRLHSP